MKISLALGFLLLFSGFQIWSQDYSDINLKTEKDFELYFQKKALNNYDEFEGIYYSTLEGENHVRGAFQDRKRIFFSKVVIINTGTCYAEISLPTKRAVNLNELECHITATSNPNIYMVVNDGMIQGEKYMKISEVNYQLIYELSVEEVAYIWEVSVAQVKMARGRQIITASLDKIYPTTEILANISKTNKYGSNTLVNGTAFALTMDGYVVTNYHVIEGKENITIRGVNGNMDNFNAQVVLTDKNNDIAILKIVDNSFVAINNIPYSIDIKTANTGEEVFVLGYPLRATMGDEIKLTNGIISSRTGFRGDVTVYQVSAPVQPGNSGAPMFNSSGEIIGIVNAKHTDAENASYAIKTNYLMNLIELLPDEPELQSVSLLKGKSLPEKVSLIKNFVYIIEAK